MKIMFVVGSLSGGGAERVVAELSSKLSEQGHDVYVALIASMKTTYNISEKVTLLDCTRRYRVPGLGFAKRALQIRKMIVKYRPDVVVSFTVAVNIYTVLSRIGTRTQLVLAERNDPRFDPAKKSARIARKLLYPFADSFVFQTEGEKEFFSKKIQKRSLVIYNPVNPDIPQPFAGERRLVFTSVARLEPQKNIKMTIDAFKRGSNGRPEFSLEIYGDGSLKNELEDYIKEQNLSGRVLLKGASNTVYEDIKDCFGFLLSSNYEGMSNSLIEAMALGLPVISTDCPSGGAREIIKDSVNGFLVPVGDTVSMAEKIKLLINDEKLQNAVSREAIKIRQTLDINKISNQWVLFLRQSEEKSESKKQPIK
jgi:GalNAc-alpha-(1->4)-GalNAc-alpha-(1->3)-diNAcBac-PP-undecaprenol alpha-1,4-N-acetyl-D-galactosaminyltransferase